MHHQTHIRVGSNSPKRGTVRGFVIIDAEGQSTTGVISTRKNINDSRSTLLSRKTSINDSSDVRVVSPGHVDRTDRMDDNDSVRANPSNSVDLMHILSTC